MVNALLILLLPGASKLQARTYVDIFSGKTMTLVKGNNGIMIEAESGMPVYLYYQTGTTDTIYGYTGKSVNGHVIRYDAVYNYDEDVDVVVNNGKTIYKVKPDKVKYMNGSYKYKRKEDKEKIKYNKD